jgi:hypothetical protein
MTARIAMCAELSMPDWSNSKKLVGVEAVGLHSRVSSIIARSSIIQDDSNGGSGLKWLGACRKIRLKGPFEIVSYFSSRMTFTPRISRNIPKSASIVLLELSTMALSMIKLVAAKRAWQLDEVLSGST